jgi:hypothetical protein
MQRAKAFAAMPLLHAIAYQMRLHQKSRVPITEDTWEFAGDPRTAKQRHTMIEVLQRIPSIVRLERSQRTGSKYAAIAGIWWYASPPLAARDEIEEPADVGH